MRSNRTDTAACLGRTLSIRSAPVPQPHRSRVDRPLPSKDHPPAHRRTPRRPRWGRAPPTYALPDTEVRVTPADDRSAAAARRAMALVGERTRRVPERSRPQVCDQGHFPPAQRTGGARLGAYAAAYRPSGDKSVAQSGAPPVGFRYRFGRGNTRWRPGPQPPHWGRSTVQRLADHVPHGRGRDRPVHP